MPESLISEQINQEPGLKSFDILASVKLYQHDLETGGFIRPETKQRVYDEELSYIAEGINRQNYTEFVLQERGGELVYFHGGQWQPYLSTLIKGLKTAEAEAETDPRKQFEADRRAADLQRGYQLQKLSPGQKVSWHYGFPHEELALYGEKFIGDMGFYPARAMGYLCEAEKTADGRMVLRHQSVDNSDKDAFEASMFVGARGGSIDQMREAYDAVLEQKTGESCYAGRRQSDGPSEESAWEIVVRNKDLIEGYFLNEIENLAALSLPFAELETAKKRLTYGVWAAIKERLDKAEQFGEESIPGYGDVSIQQEVSTAYDVLSARGEVLFGCGGSIAGEKALLGASSEDVFNLVFGSKREKMSCPFCGATQYGDPCSPNQFCGECTAKVENGRVVSRGHGRKIKKGFLDVLLEEVEEFNRKYEQERSAKKAAELIKQKAETQKLPRAA